MAKQEEAPLDQEVNTETETGETPEETGEESTEETAEETTDETSDETSAEDTTTEETPEETLPNVTDVEEEPVVEVKDKTPADEKPVWKENRLLKKELEKVQRDLEYMRGRMDGTKPATTDQNISSSAPVIPQTANEKLTALDSAFENGTFNGDYNQYITERAVIAIQERNEQIARDTRVKAEQKAFTDAVAERESTLPGVKDAMLRLISNPEVANDKAIGMVVGENLQSGGIDLAYYLSNHPKMTAELMKLPAGQRFKKLDTLREQLIAPRKPVTKQPFKPTPQIKNSVQSVKGGEVDEIAAEIMKVAAARKGK